MNIKSICSDILVLGSLIGLKGVILQVCTYFTNLMTTLSPPFEKLSGVKLQVMNRHFFITNVSACHCFSNVCLPFFWMVLWLITLLLQVLNIAVKNVWGEPCPSFPVKVHIFYSTSPPSTVSFSVCEWNLYLWCVMSCLLSYRLSKQVSSSSLLHNVVRQDYSSLDFFCCAFYFRLFLFSIRFILRAI